LPRIIRWAAAGGNPSGGRDIDPPPRLPGRGLIEKARIVRETREGRMQEVEVKLSDWVFNAIRAKEVSLPPVVMFVEIAIRSPPAAPTGGAARKS
jgi:hypothetical protein